MGRKRDYSPWVELFLEYFVASIAETIGAILVTKLGKYLRKKYKRWRACGKDEEAE
jgi:hypothetical protein